MFLQRTVVLLRRVDCMFCGLLRIARTLSLYQQVVLIMSTTVSIEGVCVSSLAAIYVHTVELVMKTERDGPFPSSDFMWGRSTNQHHYMSQTPPLWKLLFQGHLCLTEPKRLWVSCCYLNNTTYLSPLIYSYILCGGLWVCYEMKAPKLYFYVNLQIRMYVFGGCLGIYREILWM